MTRQDSTKRIETAQASNSLPADMRTVPESEAEQQTKPVFSELAQPEMDRHTSAQHAARRIASLYFAVMPS